VPDPRSLFRLAALAGFLILAALGLWLLDAEWPVVIAVMGAAWVLAAVVEWAAWRQGRVRGAGVRSSVVGAEEEEAFDPAAAALRPPEAAEEVEEREEVPLVPPKPETVSAPVSEPPVSEEEAAESEPAAPVPLRAPREQPARPPLRPVPPPPPQPPPQPVTPPAAARAAAPSGVVDLRRRATAQARRWNLWDLERLARDELQRDPQRLQELSYLFVHLRQFASPDGSLPTEFDPLVRESLGDLLEQQR
jgi:hypothetical protein